MKTTKFSKYQKTFTKNMTNMYLPTINGIKKKSLNNLKKWELLISTLWKPTVSYIIKNTLPTHGFRFQTDTANSETKYDVDVAWLMT